MTRIASTFGPQGFGVYAIEWSDVGPSFEKVDKSSGHILLPGFIDIHCHGAYGIDFMSATDADMHVLCDRLQSQGYEGLLPTTVTAPAKQVLAALDHLINHPLILGFHLEGPFISPEFPGAQPPQDILNIPTEASEWDQVLDDPRLKVITLAPERPNAVDLISRLSLRGVIVSMGHTNATYDEARFGFEFGARHTTHTFNAMRGLHHREAGTLGYALLQDGLACELIYDRHHVSTEAARLLIKSKPPHQVIAVSDSSKATGLPPQTEIDMWGHRAVVGRGTVTLKESSTLAGSCITLLDAFRNLTEDFGVETAIRLCSLNPRRALGITGMPRVWIELDANLEVVDRFEQFSQP